MDFKQACYTKGFVRTKKSDDITHVLMNRGILHVPSKRIAEFYELCIKHIKSGEKIYVVEQKTPVFAFFVDIDYQDDDELTESQIMNITSIIHDVVSKFHKTRALISTSEPKTKGDKIKTGVHLNWEGVFVDCENANYLRAHIVKKLTDTYSNMKWEDIIDSCVYGSIDSGSKGSGFRMPWSHKMVKGVIEGEYIPKFMISVDDDIIEISDDPCVDILNFTTLRTVNEKSIKIEPLTAPLTLYVKRPKKEEGFKKTQMKDVINDIQLLYDLNVFVNKNMIGQIGAKVTELFNYERTILLNTTSQYCENLGRTHKSNHVYFVIPHDRKNIYQKCFCTCDTIKGRRHGHCKEFVSRKYKLPPSLTERLKDA